MSRPKQRFSEYSPRKQFAIMLLTSASVGLVAAAELDIQRRRPERVRGSRALWRLLALNALGAAAYFCLGRRGAS